MLIFDPLVQGIPHSPELKLNSSLQKCTMNCSSISIYKLPVPPTTPSSSGKQKNGNKFPLDTRTFRLKHLKMLISAIYIYRFHADCAFFAHWKVEQNTACMSKQPGFLPVVHALRAVSIHLFQKTQSVSGNMGWKQKKTVNCGHLCVPI